MLGMENKEQCTCSGDCSNCPSNGIFNYDDSEFQERVKGTFLESNTVDKGGNQNG